MLPWRWSWPTARTSSSPATFRSPARLPGCGRPTWSRGCISAHDGRSRRDGRSCERGSRPRRLRILLRTKAVSVETNRDRVEAVLAIHLDERRWTRVRPRVVIDATEFGDLLALAGAEYVVGAETKAETGEPHAQPLEAKPHCVQSFTYTFVLENAGSGAHHAIPRPERYEHYRDSQPYSLRIHVHGGEIYGESTGWLDYAVMEQAP